MIGVQSVVSAVIQHSLWGLLIFGYLATKSLTGHSTSVNALLCIAQLTVGNPLPEGFQTFVSVIYISPSVIYLVVQLDPPSMAYLIWELVFILYLTHFPIFSCALKCLFPLP